MAMLGDYLNNFTNFVVKLSPCFQNHSEILPSGLLSNKRLGRVLTLALAVEGDGERETAIRIASKLGELNLGFLQVPFVVSETRQCSGVHSRRFVVPLYYVKPKTSRPAPYKIPLVTGQPGGLGSGFYGDGGPGGGGDGGGRGGPGGPGAIVAPGIPAGRGGPGGRGGRGRDGGPGEPGGPGGPGGEGGYPDGDGGPGGEGGSGGPPLKL